MKISLNWLKEYVDIKIPNDELVRLIGARLVEVEGVIDETHKYDDIYVARVEKAEKIPDTHLTLCQINDNNELIQVVCGAPNVREGMLAAWIKPGAIIPASVHEDAPFVIGRRKMLGRYDSCGMLAGADELDFGDDHSGIVEIDPALAKPGDLLADVFELNDLVLEIENKSLTHRPDTFGIIGFAREVAGILGQEFKEREASNATTFLQELPHTGVDIEIVQPNICSRYTTVVLEKHGEIKRPYLTLQDTRLAKAGMKPISPIVDATNYLMLLTGQPLHAFDYDKFVKVGKSDTPKIIVRLARVGEKLTLLDGNEIVMDQNDVVITSNDVPVALAGAMGGESTMIDDSTRNIIIESATFSLFNLRKTQMKHGIFSEAITRFTKGQPPFQTLSVAGECAKMLESGFKAIAVSDAWLEPNKAIVVKITTDEINALLGTNYDTPLIVKTLENVGFEITLVGGAAGVTSAARSEVSTVGKTAVTGSVEQMAIKIPAWRTDVHIKEDIIEEVGRLLGYDNIAPTLPLHATADSNSLFSLKKHIRQALSRFGANEVLTYSFVSERLLEKAGQSPRNSYKIVNSISPELQYIRQSIVPSLLDKAYFNEKLPVEKFAIFELNQIYRRDLGFDDDNVPNYANRLGFVVAERKNSETAFYKVKMYLVELLKEFNIAVELLPLKGRDAEKQPFEPKRAAEIWLNQKSIGVVGEFKKSVKYNFKLADYVAGFEIDIDEILQNAGEKKIKQYKSIETQDVTITTDKSCGEVLNELQAKYPMAEIVPGVVYQAEGQRDKNLTFHLTFYKA